jgi:hypothetical protein
MTVQLVVHEMPKDHLIYNNYEAYVNFLKHIDKQGWPYIREEQKRLINHMLTPYHARLAEFHFMRIVLEFDSPEDLTQFVLTWS